MALHDPLYNCQPEAPAGNFRRKERLEDVRLDLFFHACARVGHLQAQIIALR